MDDFRRSDPAAVSDPQPATSARRPAATPLGEPGLKAPGLSSRNLLRIKVPVRVTLASKKQAIGKIVEMAPGSILQFDKSCADALDLEVGTQRIAQGECVTVGDQFGLRINSLSLPAKRLESVATTPE